MMWGFLTVIAAALVLLFAAPFVGFLTPEDAIWLVDTTNQSNPSILAKGASTLWYQWQSWSYIFTFCLITACVLGLIYNAIRTFSDETLIEAKQKLAQKTEELETLKRQYRHKVEQDVLRAHAKESERLKNKEYELDHIQHLTAEQQNESQERMKMASHAVRHQQKVTQSKLGQRDRLSNEKKLLAEYIEEMDWKFTDGSKVTYSALVKLAKENKKNG
ncbi:TPA: hypothetical protein NJ360_004564 [Vibrio parahaemolyticus]|uniref:hypothetical protein n=1 Tax=Vibrio parahaemolyticus TaxID=670 RepID=UPI000A3AED47|nr:hypothetical protein [Vibrio parahaemolyticus]MBE3740239.1 hypothetical protein [Vibrio parahaemolyticus]MDF4667309.1 hypothetical protein [Vibrio parahaemolyticus]MDF4730128.1 hypothetical protein [Vibrio parahaemolyticus]MDF4971598.1 hypothetical protein [Vibrio parahaemolyticus]OUD48921.1 hypothetical protein BTA15_24285 [Vibrio parahaemolyticus]